MLLYGAVEGATLVWFSVGSRAGLRLCLCLNLRLGSGLSFGMSWVCIWFRLGLANGFV